MANFDYDVLVVGSGFGGSVSVLRLTEKGYRVGVLEAGRRFSAQTLPKTNWDLRNFLWFPRLGMRGIQRLTLLKDVLILSGAGVGGGSLVYANTLYEPLEAFWHDKQWAHITDWRQELAPHYDQARRMLGATQTPFETPADKAMQELAKYFDAPETYHPTTVGVYFGEPGVQVPDPYFGGVGPDRRGCIKCGACMVGCRHNAKNTLEQNYLYLAEQAGAKIHPECEVVDLEALSSGGYRVTTQRPGSISKSKARTFTAEQIVFSAGVLGTLKLLFKLKAAGRLPKLSDRLGDLVRTNSEIIAGAEAPDTSVDYSDGIAITSSIHPDEHTHMEPVRYPKGSNSMGLLASIMVDGGGRTPRQLKFLAQIVRNPKAFVRSMSVKRWSERTIILLVMQSLDNSLRIRARVQKSGRVKLTSSTGDGAEHPSYLPIANEASRQLAKTIGGEPRNAINEVLLDVPITAHILGGACIGESSATGVIDSYQRVYGYEGLHVADGSAIGANLGVNPSLTITAMTERAMSLWPNKGEQDQRPVQGEAYLDVQPIFPKNPAVPAHAPAALRLGGPSSS